MATKTAGPDGPATVPERRLPPGPRGHFLLGLMREQSRDRLNFQTNLHRTYGDLVRWRVANVGLCQISHPDHLKHVLQENQRNYTKGRVMYRMLSPLAGDGLFTSEGDFWRRQRRLMQPIFHRQRIAAFGSIMTTQTVAMLDRWEPQMRRGAPVDVAEEMMALTLSVVAQALFGADVRKDAAAIYDAFTTVSEHLIHLFDVPWYPSPRIPTPRNRRFVGARRALDDVVYRLIDEHRARDEEDGDLLSMLLAARDEETGEGMTREQLRDEVMTLLLAGHETTANALTWTWHLLSQNPEADRRLREELAAVLGGRLPEATDLPNLPYTRMVIEESMRLYPPVWATHRQAIADDEIGGYHIPAKTILDLQIYVTHHRPDVWEQPETFDPERFSAERSAGRHKFAFNPFLAGPRKCIGVNFAMVEAQLVLATMAQRYRLELAPDTSVVPLPQLTLRPQNGLPMIVHPA